MEKVFVNVDRYGNMSSASVPVALDEAREQGRVGAGSLVLMVAFGAGFTWARQRGAAVSDATRVGLLFPGQGSQFVGMGRDLAERFPEARAAFQEADDALGRALSRLCWEGPEEELTLTVQRPARHPGPQRGRLARAARRDAPRATVAAGHSLGEFSAYVAAGALSFADAVRTVRRRGELMYRSGRERPGTMAAVLGLDDAVVERGLRARRQRGRRRRGGRRQLQRARAGGDLRRRGGGGARGPRTREGERAPSGCSR